MKKVGCKFPSLDWSVNDILKKYRHYIFQFTATFVGKESPVSFTKDIYVGTVPMSRREMKSCIAGMFNQPYVDSIENLADVPQKSKSQISLTHIIAQAVTQVSKQYYFVV